MSFGGVDRRAVSIAGAAGMRENSQSAGKKPMMLLSNYKVSKQDSADERCPVRDICSIWANSW
jgi:hypothetical protein